MGWMTQHACVALTPSCDWYLTPHSVTPLRTADAEDWAVYSGCNKARRARRTVVTRNISRLALLDSMLARSSAKLLRLLWSLRRALPLPLSLLPRCCLSTSMLRRSTLARRSVGR